MKEQHIMDWHKKGNFVVVGPDKKPLHWTMGETPYAARAEFLHEGHKHGHSGTWTAHVERGFYVDELMLSGAKWQ